MMGLSMRDREFVERVRHLVDLVEVVSERVSLRKQGSNLVGLCPFHDERTPSFTVSPERQLYYCFGCGAGGDVFSFMMNIEGLDFTQSLESLARRAGVEMPARDSADPRAREKQAVLAALDMASRYFRAVLEKTRFGREVRSYLAKRGVEGELIQRFELGCALPTWDGLGKALAAKGIKQEEMLAAGLIAPSSRGGYYDRFRGRLMFPIWDSQGRVVAFGGRLMEGEGAKYINSPETAVFRKGTFWYGLHLSRPAIRKKEAAVVVEGYTDVIACHREGYENVVASMGTALTREQAWTLARLTDRVLIAYDADRAGQEATLRGLDMFGETGCDVRVAVLPSGLDPDDFLRQQGRKAFEAVLEGAAPLFEYRMKVALSRNDTGSVGGKVAALRELSPALLSMGDEIARDEGIRMLAERLEVDEGAIRQELVKAARRTGRKRPSSSGEISGRGSPAPPALGQVPPAVLKAERQIIRLIMEDSRRFSWTRGDLPPGVEPLIPDHFTDPGCRSIMQAIQEAAAQEEDPRPAEVVRRMEGEQHKRLLSALVLEDFGAIDPKRTMHDCMIAIARHRTQKRVREIQRQIKALEEKGEEVPSDLMQDLLKQQRRLHGIPGGRAPAGREGRDHS